MILKNKKIFISGAAGVIGRQLVKLLEKQKCIIFAADIKNKPAEFSNKIFYRQGDLNHIKEHEIVSYNCDVFIHLAATFERTSENFSFYRENFKHNICLSNKLLDFVSKTKNIKKILFASSYLIYDKNFYLKKNLEDPFVLNENSLKEPRNLVGTTKYYHEKEIEFYKKFKKKIQFHNIRIFRGYGPGSRDIISRWIRLALKNKTLKSYNLESSFDFIFSIDTARGILQILKKDPKELIINLGSGKSVKINDVILNLKSYFPNLKLRNLKSDYLIEKSRSGNKVMNQINWSPKFDLKNAIKKIIEYERKKLKENTNKIKNKILITCFGEKKITWLPHIINAKNRINENLELLIGNSRQSKFLNSIYGKILIMPQIKDYSFTKILKILKLNKISTVLPTNNDELLFWSKNKKKFLKNKINIIISPHNSIEMCNDKFKFYEFCKKNKIPTIKSINNLNKIQTLGTTKYVIKDRFGSGGKQVLKNINDKKLQENLSDIKDFLIQEYIPSKNEYSIDAWYSGDLKLCQYFVRKREYVVDGESKITTVVKNFKYKKVLEKYLKKFKLYGPINFQFFEYNERIIFIECNPRIGGASTFSVISGLDLIYYAFLNSYYNNPNYDKILNKKILSKKKQIRVTSDIYEDYSF